MYPVSDAYLTARRSRVREERITGGIKLKDGTIITVDDSVIIQNSLSVSKKVCSSGKFDIGTVNCSVLEMKLVDDSAYDHEFGGALIRLKYGIVTGVDEGGNKTWEEVPLPPFFADGSEVTRKWNVVSITAYDPISLLNMDYPDTIPTTSLYAALGYVCARAGLGLAISEEEFNSLPNSSVIPDFSSSQIESCLDVAMWIAQTVNCCGFVDYRGLFDLKQYKYTGGNNYDRLFTEDEIKDIKYSDTRTYLAYLQAYVSGKVKLYSKVTAWTGTDASHTKEGALALPKNPILSKLTEEEQAAINSSYLENRSYPTRYIKMTGWVDPALELMDVVAFSGKMIDVGQIINVATQIKWCYGKCGSIYCASVSENAEPSGGTSAVSLSSVTESDSSEIKRLQPKSQIQKRVDAIEAELKNSSGSASALTEYEYLTDLSAKCNGLTYTAEKDADTGLISKITDSVGNEFKPTINSGITDTAFHNAVFMAVAMCRGLKNISNDVLLYSGFDGSERYSGITGFTAIKNSYQKTSGISLRNQSDGTLALTFEKANSIYIDTGTYGDGNTDTIVIRSNEKINLTNYNKLRLTMNLGTNYTAGSFDGMLFFTTGTPEAAQKNVAYDFTDWELIASTTSGFSDYSNPGTFSDVDVDISALDGEHYLNFAVFHGTQQSQFSVYAFFKEIRLIQ